MQKRSTKHNDKHWIKYEQRTIMQTLILHAQQKKLIRKYRIPKNWLENIEYHKNQAWYIAALY